MKAHRTDVVSFAFGLVFVALAVWWLLARILELVLPPVGWFVAGALILVGLLSLVGALRSARHADPGPADPWSAATVAASGVRGTPTSGGPSTSATDEWVTDPVDGPEWPAGRSTTGGPPTGGDEPGRNER